MGDQYRATVKSLEADVRDAEVRWKQWVARAYEIDHLNGHTELGPGGPCPVCKGLS
jgi:hypothetical protein